MTPSCYRLASLNGHSDQLEAVLPLGQNDMAARIRGTAGYKTWERVRQFGACKTVRWESEPGKAVAGSRYTALEPRS